MIDYKQRQRSLSDSTDLNSPGAFTAEKLRKTQSYTAFPHINKKSTYFDDEPSFNFYRTSCFRIMPHLSEGYFNNEYFPTISVLSRSSQFENYPLNMTCEISSESEDSGWELEINDQTLLFELVFYAVVEIAMRFFGIYLSLLRYWCVIEVKTEGSRCLD